MKLARHYIKCQNEKKTQDSERDNLHIVKNIFLHFADLRMIVKPALDTSLVCFLPGRIGINFLFLFFARENQIFDQVQAPVGEVVVILIGVRTCYSPVLDGWILAGLKMKDLKII